MGRLMVFVALAGALLGLTSPSPASAAPERTVTVVTQNLYIGADLSPILAAPDLQAALEAVGQVFAAVQASHPAARMPDAEIPPEEDVVEPLEQRRGHVTEVGVLTAGQAVGSGVLPRPRVAEARVSEQHVRRRRVGIRGVRAAVAVAHQHDWQRCVGGPGQDLGSLGELHQRVETFEVRGHEAHGGVTGRRIDRRPAARASGSRAPAINP